AVIQSYFYSFLKIITENGIVYSRRENPCIRILRKILLNCSLKAIIVIFPGFYRLEYPVGGYQPGNESLLCCRQASHLASLMRMQIFCFSEHTLTVRQRFAFLI